MFDDEKRDGARDEARAGEREMTTASAALANELDEVALVVAITDSVRDRAVADAAEARRYAELWEVCAERAARRTSGESFDAALDLELRTVSMTIGMRTNLSDRTIRARFDDAVMLVNAYPTLLQALERGAITSRHARVIMIESEPLTDPATRADYLERALELATSTTPGRLEGKLRRLAADLDREAAHERLATERTRRCVEVRDRANGMSELRAYLPSPVAHAIHDRLTELAKSDRPIDTFGRPAPTPQTCPICVDGFMRVAPAAAALITASNPDADARWEPCPNCVGHTDPAPGANVAERAGGGTGLDGFATSSPCGDGELDGTPDDPRSFDAVRADALADLLLAGTVPDDSRHSAINTIQGRIAITVPALALTGATDEIATQDGVGPIDLDLAMRLTAGATIWQRVLTDPLTGIPIAADTYRPPAELARFIEARDQDCRAPGCRRPAIRCDLDHTIPYAEGGTTSADNLAALCRYHHVAKHRGWTVVQGPNGQLTWMSPTGTTSIESPEPLGTPMSTAEVEYLIEHATSPPGRSRPPTEGPRFRPKAA